MVYVQDFGVAHKLCVDRTHYRELIDERNESYLEVRHKLVG
jgi:hypothetical protein